MFALAAGGVRACRKSARGSRAITRPLGISVTPTPPSCSEQQAFSELPLSIDMIRVFILASVRLYRESLSRMLARSEGVDVVGCHSLEREAESQISALRPSVVVLDMCTPE